MSTRISSLAALLLLAACGEAPSAGVAEQGATARAEAAAERIECAGAGEAFARTCTVDRTETRDGLVLTLRRPDGGFRRLRVTHDGRGVVAADGAEAARVAPIGREAIEVAIGGIRYRLPATVAPPRPQ